MQTATTPIAPSVRFANFDSHTRQYLNLICEILAKYNDQGSVNDRTKVGRTRVFGKELIFNMTDGSFPLITCKHVPYRLVKEELFWFLDGSTNIKNLGENNHIWDKWALKEDKVVYTSASLKEHFADMFNPENDIYEKLMKIPEAIVGNWNRKHVYRKGDIGPMYGKTWRDFDGVDQISDVYHLLRTQPFTSRACVSSWDPKNFPIVDPRDPSLESDYEFQVTSGRMALNPCHAFFQFLGEPMTFKERIGWLLNNDSPNYRVIKNDLAVIYLIDSVEKAERHAKTQGKLEVLTDYLDNACVPSVQLTLKLTQRSCDLGLGAPFNIASYALLLHMFAMSLNYAVKELIYSLGDCHLYSNQIDAMQTMVDAADNTTEEYKSPRLVTDFCNLGFNNYDLSTDYSYVPYPWLQHKYEVLPENNKFKIWEIAGYKSLGVFKMDAAA